MKKTGALALMVKTPGLSPVKTRLAASVGVQAAQSFHILSAHAVAAIMQCASGILGLESFFAVAETEGLDSQHWKSMPNLFQGDGGLGKRMHRIYSNLQKSHGTCILLGADTPQLEIADLASAITWLSASKDPRFFLGPAGDGGFWIFGGNGPLPESLFTEVNYSQPNTGIQFQSNLAPYGPLQIHRTLHDVDCRKDLSRVHDDLTRLSHPLKEQTELLDWIKELFSHISPPPSRYF